MTSRNNLLDRKLSLKTFVLQQLRKKNKNFGKNKINIPPYLLAEMRKSSEVTKKESNLKQK